MASVVLAVLFLAVVATIVYLGSLPGKIARARNHPQADAINAASWIGLALAGAGWPIAFVWAFLQQAPLGGRSDEASRGEADPRDKEIAELVKRLDSVEKQLAGSTGGNEQ